MKIQTNNYCYHPKNNFGHTFKVNICITNPDGTHKFVSPATDTKLYKELNSKVVGWLNEDFLTQIREKVGAQRKIKKRKTDNDLWSKNRLVQVLKNQDSDYKELPIVRSVYSKYGLGYIATGIDVPIIENLKGAKQIGIAKRDALWETGFSHNEYVNSIVKAYNKNSLKYVKDPINLLRSKKGKEIMLKLNFRLSDNPNKKKDVYVLDNYDFYEIQKSEPLTTKQKSVRTQVKSLYYEVINMISHQIRKMKPTQNVTAKEILTSFDEIAEQTPVRKKTKRLKNDPRQLELKFKN